ncbi:MAG: hypothetical protein IJT41_10095 [Clostridia bacterium]|nr:hypothetical protein [Clostridia bacterium]
MKHSTFTKILSVCLAVAMLIPGGALFASAECDHDFSVKQVVAEPTCTIAQISNYYCSKCGEVEKNSEGEAINYYGDKTLHDLIADGDASKSQYYAKTTEATCEDAGVIDYYCKICNDWIYDEEIEALGHDPIPKITQEATVDHPGVKATVCARCDKILETETFTIHDHYCDPDAEFGYKRILTPATCTVDGELGCFCGVCGALFAVEPIEAEGHHNAQLTHYLGSEYELEEYIGFTNVVTTKPTCTEDGVITFLCDECGEVVRSYPLDRTGHYNRSLSQYYTDPDAELEDFIGCMNVETTMPTCTAEGSISFLCEDCGIVMKTFRLDKTGHYNYWLDWYLTDTEATLEDCCYGRNVEYTQETCTKSGKLTFLCDTCGEVIRSYTLKPTGHTDGYQKEITAATCMTAGEMGTYCANCGELLKTEPIAALGHDYGEWTPNGDKTHSHSCSRCQFTDKATCKFNATVTDPTCTEGGYTTYVCADCGYTYVDDYTDALGHDWGAWTDDGDETHSRVCARCSEKETEAHCFGEWVYNHDAKFFKNGTKSMTCDVCGKVVTEKAQFTAWIWHPFYPLMLWVGSIVHKSVFLASLAWFLPWLNIQPKM